MPIFLRITSAGQWAEVSTDRESEAGSWRMMRSSINILTASS